MKTEFLQNFKVGEQSLPKEIIARRLNVCRQIRLLSLLKMRQFELYRAIRKSPEITTVFVHKDVFSYERLVATSVMEAAAFSLSTADHGLDDSAIASISFMVARSTSPTQVKWMSIPTRLCPFTISLL